MLFGHQNDNTGQAMTMSSAPAVGVNPLAVDPATGASLPATPPAPPAPPMPPVAPATDTSVAEPEEAPSVLNQPTATPAEPSMPMPAFINEPFGSVPQVPTTTVDAPVTDPLPEPVAAPEPAATPDLVPDLVSEPAPEPAQEPTSEPTPEPEAQAEPEPEPQEVEEPSPFASTSDNDSNDDHSDNDDNTSPAQLSDASDLLTIKQQALGELEPLVDQLEQTPEEHFRTTMMLIQSTDNPARIQDAYKAAQAITDEKVRAQALLDVINEINYFTQAKPTE